MRSTAGDREGNGLRTGRRPPDFERTLRAVSRSKAIASGLTAAAILSGVVLRWFHLGKQSLDFDEGYTAWTSSLSPAYIVRHAQSSDFPPLHFLLQHYWGLLFGNSEYALRSLSAFFGTLSLPVFYFLAKKVLKDSMAVALAMWVFAFSLMHVWYSQFARSYGLLSFLALVGLYALVLFLERRSVAWFVIIVLSVAGSLYTHNMMFFYLLALDATWLIYPSERAWSERVKELLLANVLAGLLYLPWAPILLTQAARFRGDTWLPSPTVSHLLASLSLIVGFNLDYLKALAVRFLPLSSETAWACVVGGVSLLCAALVAGGLWRVSKRDRSRSVSLLLYCLLPILAVFVLSRMTPSVFVHYIFINSSAVVPILFAYPLALQKGRKGRILYGFLGIVLGATAALSAFGYLRYEEKEDWRGASASLLRIPEGNRLIVFITKTGEILFDYYARRSPAMSRGVEKTGLPESFLERFPPPPRRFMVVSDLDPLKRAVESKKYSEIDLVLSHEWRHDPNGLALGYLDRVCIRQEERRFNGVRIVRFLAPPH